MLLNEIVSNAVDSMSLGENEFTKCYRIAQRCIRQLKWDFIGTIKTVELSILPNMTCKLPSDFVSERKIGPINETTGQIATLTEDSNLSLLDATNPDRILQPSRHSRETVMDEMNYLSEYGSLEPSNLGSNRNIGGYRIDRKQNLLVLDPNFNYGKIQIEYIGSTTEGGNCEVPEMVSEAILFFVIWQYNFARKGVSGFDKQNYENQYYNELSKAKARVTKITKSQMNQNSRESISQSIKG